MQTNTLLNYCKSFASRLFGSAVVGVVAFADVLFIYAVHTERIDGFIMLPAVLIGASLAALAYFAKVNIRESAEVVITGLKQIVLFFATIMSPLSPLMLYEAVAAVANTGLSWKTGLLLIFSTTSLAVLVRLTKLAFIHLAKTRRRRW